MKLTCQMLVSLPVALVIGLSAQVAGQRTRSSIRPGQSSKMPVSSNCCPSGMIPLRRIPLRNSTDGLS